MSFEDVGADERAPFQAGGAGDGFQFRQQLAPEGIGFGGAFLRDETTGEAGGGGGDVARLAVTAGMRGEGAAAEVEGAAEDRFGTGPVAGALFEFAEAVERVAGAEIPP